MTLVQLPISEWPPELTEEVAKLRQEPEDFEQSGSIRFEETFDDLDYFKAAILVPGQDPPFALWRYRGSPVSGVTLFVIQRTPEQLRQSIDNAIEVLRLDKDSVTWTRFDVPSGK